MEIILYYYCLIVIYLFVYFKNMFIDFREKVREEERKEKKH